MLFYFTTINDNYFFRNKNTASKKPIKIFKIKEMYDVLLGGKSLSTKPVAGEGYQQQNSMNIRYSYGVNILIYRLSTVYVPCIYRISTVVDSGGI